MWRIHSHVLSCSIPQIGDWDWPLFVIMRNQKRIFYMLIIIQCSFPVSSIFNIFWAIEFILEVIFTPTTTNRGSQRAGYYFENIFIPVWFVFLRQVGVFGPLSSFFRSFLLPPLSIERHTEACYMQHCEAPFLGNFSKLLDFLQGTGGRGNLKSIAMKSAVYIELY